MQNAGLAALFDRAINSNEVLAVVIAAVLAGVGWIIGRTIVGRGNVGWGVSNQHFYNLGGTPPVSVHTREIWVQNIGRSIAEEVDVLLLAPPGHWEIWPKRHYTSATNPDGSFMIRVDQLNSREWFTISMFQINGSPPLLNNVRWKGGVGKEVAMAPSQQHPAWKLHIFRILIWVGIFSILYFPIKLFI